MKTTITADAIYARVRNRLDSFFIMEYKYKELNGTLRIEIPITSLNSHLKVGDEVEMDLRMAVLADERHDAIDRPERHSIAGHMNDPSIMQEKAFKKESNFTNPSQKELQDGWMK